MNTTAKLSGLLAAPVTPFFEDGSVNYDKISILEKLYLANGVRGVFICGSTGEGSSLSFEEKMKISETWGNLDSRLDVILCVGGIQVGEMKELSSYAQQLGFRGVAMLSPYYFRPTSLDVLIQVSEEVAQSAPDLEFYYYHIPPLTHVNFPMIEYLRQAGPRIPNLRGIKYSYNDLYDFQQCVNVDEGKYSMLWGSDEVLLSAMAAGAIGAVGSTYNYASPLYRKVIDAFKGGNMQLAKKWQDKSIEMVKLLIKYGGTGATKAFMKIIGVDCGPARLPVQLPSVSAMKELEAELEGIGFFEFCSRIN